MDLVTLQLDLRRWY